jgi:hypothetical protein
MPGDLATNRNLFDEVAFRSERINPVDAHESNGKDGNNDGSFTRADELLGFHGRVLLCVMRCGTHPEPNKFKLPMSITMYEDAFSKHYDNYPAALIVSLVRPD